MLSERASVQSFFTCGGLSRVAVVLSFRILACLMEKVDTDKMTDDCEDRLMEIQYFVSRDFKYV